MLGEGLQIRSARREDVGTIFELIAGLAEYERAREQVTGTPELLECGLFGPAPTCEAVVASAVSATGSEVLGFALFHGTFSTWECMPGIWLEDLYVRPEHRRGGVGEALLARVAAITVERGWTRLGWVALDWNEPALSFYARLGADVLEEWKVHRLSGPRLAAVAALAG